MSELPVQAPKKSNTLLIVAAIVLILGIIMAVAFNGIDNRDKANRKPFSEYKVNEYVSFDMTEVNEAFAEREADYYYWVLANGQPVMLEVNKDLRDRMDELSMSTEPFTEKMEGVVLEAEKDLQDLGEEFYLVDFPDNAALTADDPIKTHYISTFRYAWKPVYYLQLFGWLFIFIGVMILLYWGLKRLGVK